MKALTPEQVASFHYNGFLYPIPALSPEEIATYLAGVERLETELGSPVADADSKWRSHAYAHSPWFNDLIRHPRILDAVEDVIGPDILCWGTTFFTKEARNPGYVSWHQDSTYWGLEPPDIITAWVAFTDSNAANGAMRVIPGTHKMDQVPHRDTFAADNLLSRGQEIEVEVNERDAAMLELAAGEMSLHHVRLIHGSDPNPSDDRRIGFAIRYVPTYVRQVAGSTDSATLVRGEDRFHNFELEQRPDADMSPGALAHHAAVAERYSQILMRGTDRAMHA